MAITEVEVVGKLSLPAGLRSPYTRVLTVDAGGKGDYTTVVAAIAAAVAGGASVTVPWLIRIMPGTYTENNFTVPGGITLKGTGRWGWGGAFIVGSPTLNSGARLIQLAGIATTGTNYAIKHVVTDLQRAAVEECYWQLRYDVNGPVYGIKVSGSVAGSLGLDVINSTIYPGNHFASGTPQIVMVHQEAGTTGYVHIKGCYLKTSSGGAGLAVSPICAWSEATSADVYIQITDSTWDAYYATSPVRLKSTNTAHPGGHFNLAIATPYGSGTFVDQIAMAGTPWLYDAGCRRLTVSGTWQNPVRMLDSYLWINVAYGSLYISPTAPTSDTDGSPVATASKPRLRSGSAYATRWAAAMTTLAMVAGRLYATPFDVERPSAFSALRLQVTVASAGSTIRLGVYADDGFGKPGALLHSAGTIDGASATSQDATAGFSLNPGLYWLSAAAEGGTPTIQANTGSAPMVPQAVDSVRIGYWGAYAGGALPSTFAATVTSIAMAARVEVVAA